MAFWVEYINNLQEEFKDKNYRHANYHIMFQAILSKINSITAWDFINLRPGVAFDSGAEVISVLTLITYNIEFSSRDQ